MPKLHRRIALFLGTVLVVVLAAQSWRKGMRPQGYDLGAYLDAGVATAAGESPYSMEDTFPYLYPPFFAWAMIPFTWVPYGAALLLWYALSIAALAYALARCHAWAREFAPPTEASGRFEILKFVLIAALFFRVVHANVTNGQVNLILLGMAVAFLEAMRRKRPTWCGFWLALAVATKLVPALLGGLLLLRRRYKEIAWCAVFSAILLAAPAICYGADLVSIYAEFQTQIDAKLEHSTTNHGAWTLNSKGDVEYFTLRGFVADVITPTAALGWMKALCAVIVLGIVFLADRSMRHAAPLARNAATVSLLLLGALLISPLSEKHHLALAIPAISLSVFAIRTRPTAWQITGLAVFAACVLLSKAFPSGPYFFIQIVTAGLLVHGTAMATRDEAVATRGIGDASRHPGPDTPQAS